MRQLFLFLVVVIWFGISCQATKAEQDLITNTPTITTPVISPQLQTATPLLITTPITTQPLMTSPTKPMGQATIVATPISSTPATIIPTYESFVFNPKAVFLGGNTPNPPSGAVISSSIGVFDTQTETVQIIASGTETLLFGGPLWSPDRALVAFAQLDYSGSIHSIQVYDQTGGASWHLEVPGPQDLNEDGTIPGLFLFGWSGDGEWLAYMYIYNGRAPGSPLIHLVNVFTRERVSVEIPDPEGYLWFVWSPRNISFAIANGEAIFTGDVYSPSQQTVHQGAGFLGLIAWHPFEDKILVGSSDNRASESWNQLWQLDLGTGEWEKVGQYPHIAHFQFSPDGRFIAIHSQYFDLKRLEIVDAVNSESIQQIELPAELLFDLDWLNNDTLALTSRDNIYVIPLEAPERTYWVIDENSPLYAAFSQISFLDW